MKRFIHKYSELITGVLSCFDRILFRGYLPLGWGEAMEHLLGQQGLRIKDFAKFVTRQSSRIASHAELVAKQAGRPFIYLHGRDRKEDLVHCLIEQDQIREGLVCVLRAVEACQSFRVIPGKRRPQLVPARRKCLCFYFYYLDRQLGLIHVRIQSWFPLVIQVAVNGHEALARKLDQHGIAYRKQDNAFLWIEDVPRAQKLADRLSRQNWPRRLTALARRVNPLLGDLLQGMSYYWVIDQAEYATDVMFRDPSTLQPLYEKLVKHATLCFSAEDVLTFLGRKLHPNFQGEVLSDFKKKRWPGARIKHRMKQNCIKMYDKYATVLRIETVINQPAEFKVRRRGTRKGRTVMDWFPLPKGVANMFRYAEVSRAANARYLDALTAVDPPPETGRLLGQIARPARHKGRSYRGFNPALHEDMQLFAAVCRGEHLIHGVRNQDVRDQLFGYTKDRRRRRTQANRVSRLLKRLHVHRLIAKIPRSRRWRVTQQGQILIAAMLKCHYEQYPQLLANTAA